MEKRVFLAIFLSFGLLAVYQTYIAPPPAPPAATVTPTASGAPGTAAQPGPPQATPAPAAEAPATAPDVAARDVVVETNDIRAVFTTQGAVLKSWKLLKWLDVEGQPLELIPVEIPAKYPRPLKVIASSPQM